MRTFALNLSSEPTPKRTSYHGVRFRSALEAKFARHLHSMWEMWEYEPRVYGPKGRGYLPDFRILDKARPTFVEVKPTLKQVPGAQSKMAVIWETEPDALLIVACSEGSTYFAAVARGPWQSWVERWKSR